MSPPDEATFDLEVRRREYVAEGIVELELIPPAGAAFALPAWKPGAHIDLEISSELTRQYSLVGDGLPENSWKIAVLREKEGRGGSRFVHDRLFEGMSVKVRGPRNHFPLREGRRYLLIAGGIGITPMMAMIETLARNGAEWSLVYGGRSATSMAYRSYLTQRFGDRVSTYPQDEFGLLDLDSILGAVEPGDLVYCCGPEGLVSALEQRSAAWPDGMLQVERFAPRVVETPTVESTFEVEVAGTGQVVRVPPSQTVLQALEGAGIELPYSCSEGTCGTCETTVLEGVPDHRDSILSKAERMKNDTMFPCISRALSGRLVLDL
jgi:ferredoxin-NADP reductase